MLESCLFAIRDALRKTKTEDLLNEYEEDFVNCAYEAEKKILSDTFAAGKLMKDNLICKSTTNSQICLPQGFYSLVCCSINGNYPQLINRITCRIKSGCNCANINSSDLQVRIDGNVMTFSPAQPDGTPVTIQYESIRLEDEDGYPMIFEEHQNAVSEYIQWQIHSRYKPNLQWAEQARRDWLLSCPQARARTNSLTKADLARIGVIWYLK